MTVAKKAADSPPVDFADWDWGFEDHETRSEAVGRIIACVLMETPPDISIFEMNTGSIPILVSLPFTATEGDEPPVWYADLKDMIEERLVEFRKDKDAGQRRDLLLFADNLRNLADQMVDAVKAVGLDK